MATATLPPNACSSTGNGAMRRRRTLGAVNPATEEPFTISRGSRKEAAGDRGCIQGHACVDEANAYDA